MLTTEHVSFQVTVFEHRGVDGPEEFVNALLHAVISGTHVILSTFLLSKSNSFCKTHPDCITVGSYLSNS